MEKIQPSGSWRSLKQTLYVVCKVNSNHRDHFLLPQPIPFEVSLPLSVTVSPLFCPVSFLTLFPFCLFYFQRALFLFLSFSRLSHFIPIACVTFSFPVLVFSCSFVLLSLPLSAALFCHFISSPSLLAHSHRAPHRHTKPFL